MTLNFTLDNLPQSASEFLHITGGKGIYAFVAEMGAGKTTFISELCRQLGADDDFGSPTFSILNEYEDDKGNPIYHFDFYRLQSPREALDIGIEDYFYSGALCLIEWPEKIGNLLPEEAIIVDIKVNPDNSRTLSIDENYKATRS